MASPVPQTPSQLVLIIKWMNIKPSEYNSFVTRDINTFTSNLDRISTLIKNSNMDKVYDAIKAYNYRS